MFAMPGVAATGDAGLDWVRHPARRLALFLFEWRSLKIVAGDKMRILGADD